MSAHVLLVEDDRETAEGIARVLRAAPDRFVVAEVRTVGAALQHLASHSVECVLLADRLPDGDGLDCLREIRRSRRRPPVVLVSGAACEDVAVAAMKLGASDYLPRRAVDAANLLRAVRTVLGEHSLERAEVDMRVTECASEIDTETRALHRRAGIIGRSPALGQVLRVARRAAESCATVLLQGESGTGKERFAQAIHQLGPRARGPFIALNCAALPEALLESELFGHVRGAFTGAERHRSGLFEDAAGGSLFLDEVTEIGPSAQAKLLRVLQEREVRPLGSGRSKKIDVRVIAATNRNLSGPASQSGVRPDLYYRLSVIPILLPPLRERREDIALLAEHFLREIELRDGERVAGFAPQTLRLLERYEWPGNVRELRNEVERLVLLADPGARIVPSMLAPSIAEAASCRVADGETPLRTILRYVELATIQTRLRLHGYNRQATARSLGISREALWGKLRQLGLAAPDRRTGERRSHSDEPGSLRGRRAAREDPPSGDER